MTEGAPYPLVSSDDFSRRFSMRASGLMWLLGAGASAGAGVPTAGDMIWEFKQQLYVSQRRVSLKTVADLANPAVRRALQSFIDELGTLPPLGSPEEYAALFEAAYPSESDRRTYIAAKVTGGKPSYGHIALATLMKADKARLVWTTNFDTLIADACAKVFDGTGHLTSVALDATDVGRDTLNDERWPAEVKLHGDFRSRRLKNTNDELRQQDASLRDLLVTSCRRSGLIVAGYSGRDNSIMDALETSLEHAAPFPNGLFWLHRGEDAPLARVSDLLKKSAAKRVDGGLVYIENLDEALRDLLRLVRDIDVTALDKFASERRIWTAPPLPVGKRGFPVVRLNALELQAPTVCRRVGCSIGGHAEVVSAVETANVDIIATRVKAGVLAFGADADVRRAFEPHAINEFDLYPIEVRRLRYESNERGLIRHALTHALARKFELSVLRKRAANLLAPLDPQHPRWSPLKTLVGPLAGNINGSPELGWQEGIGMRLDWAGDRLWLLMEPRTIISGVTEENRAAATDFSRERTVRRYNKDLNSLIAFWASLLSDNGADFLALGVSTGVDANFRLGVETAFSRRVA